MDKDKNKDKGKGDDKDKKGGDGWDLDPTETIILLLILSALLTTLVPLITGYVSSGKITFFGFDIGGFFKSIIDFFKDYSFFFKALGIGLAGVGALGTFVFNKMADSIVSSNLSALYPTNISPIGVSGGSVSSDALGSAGQNASNRGAYLNGDEKNRTKSKWQKIIELVESKEESNWRLAIIEADILLDSLLEKLNIPGQTIGDKLKNVEPTDFTTIDLAWEAHKARNNIAHQGGDFLLNQREARRVISLYEAVFKEFYII
jgi:hypothetical protein